MSVVVRGATADSLSAEQEVQCPAATSVRPGPAQVTQNVGVVAASVFQRVGEDWQILERSVSIDRFGHSVDGSLVPREPALLNSCGGKRVAKHIAQDFV